MARPYISLALGFFWFVSVSSAIAQVPTPSPISTPAPSPSPSPEIEAPEALFDVKIGDADVVAEIDGTWITRLTTGWGTGIAPTGSLTSLGYPGYEKGLVFEQIPDFDVTIMLMRRYFFELGYHGAFDKNTFLLGYNGMEGEALQSVRFGNAPIEVPGRAGEAVPDGQRGNTALSVRFETASTNHDLLLRYEDSSREKRVFHGKNPADDDVVSLASWISGRFFRTTTMASGPFPGLKVLIQDPSGGYALSSVPTGGSASLAAMRFRDVKADEAYVDPTGGEIRLAQETSKVLLVSWTSVGASLTETLTSSVYNAGSVSGIGGSWYVLYQNGQYSPFEAKNYYSLPRSSTTAPDIRIVKKGSLAVDTSYTTSWVSGQTWFAVNETTVGTPPFYSLYPGLYRPSSSASTPIAALVKEEIRIRPTSSTASETISLGAGILPGSVTVLRNGVPFSGFTLEKATGNLLFDVPIYESDELEISYQKEKDFQDPTDLTIFQGNRFAFEGTDFDHVWETGLSFRWNLKQGRFTTEDFQSPGILRAATTWDAQAANWTLGAKLATAATLSDSTGYRRLYSLAQDAASVALDSNSLRPSAAAGDLGSIYATSLTEANRGIQYFRDYWSNDPLTGTPQLSAYGKPGIGRQAYENDGWIGPYLVLGDDQVSSRLIVLEGDLTGKEWMGAQAFWDRGKRRDLSNASSVRVQIRLKSTIGGTPKIVFQAGTLSENFDSTNVLSQSLYVSRPAISFTDVTRAFHLRFPTPEGTAWTNDSDGNGTFLPDGNLVTRELPVSFASTAWQTFTLALTDDERARLKSSTGWRILVVAPGETPTVLVTSAEFVGSGLSLTPANDASNALNVREIVETQAANAASSPLRAQYPEVARIFHSGGGDQKILELSWATATSWTLRGYHSEVAASAYRSIVFYSRFATGGGPFDVTLRLTDANGRGAIASWSQSVSSAWRKIEIDLVALTIAIDGSPASGGTVSLSDRQSSWDRLEMSYSGPANGSLYLAEIHLEGPQWTVATSGTISGSWTQGEAWGPKEFPLVSQTFWKTRSQVTIDSVGQTIVTGQSDVQSTLLGTRWRAETSVQVDRGVPTWHSSYEAMLPLGPLEYKQAFSDRGSRAETASLTLPYLGKWIFDARVAGPPVVLRQDYSFQWNNVLQPLVPPSTAISLSGQLLQQRSESRALEVFSRQWIDSWDWLRFRPEAANSTLALQKAAVSIPAAPWGLQIAQQLQSNQVSSSPWQFGSSGEWSFAPSYKFDLPGGAWSLGTSIGKKLSLTDRTTAGEFVGNQIEESAARLSSVDGGLWGVPFRETFASVHPLSSQGDALSQGLLESNWSANLARPRSQTWADAAFPSKVETGVRQTFKRENRSELLQNEYSFKLTSQAINLWGAKGTEPWLTWYDTDQWSWSAGYRHSRGTADADQIVSFDFATDTQWIFARSEELSLSQKWTSQATVSGTTWSYDLAPQWIVRSPAKLPFELPRWLSPSSFKRELVQKLSVQSGWAFTEAADPVFRKLQIEYRSDLTISDGGVLSFSARWGNQWQRNLFLIGLDSTLELKLKF